MAGSCGTSAAAPSPSAASPKGREGGCIGAGAVGRSDLTPDHPGVSCEGEDSTDVWAHVFSSRRSVALAPGWVTFLQKMKGALLSSATVV